MHLDFFLTIRLFFFFFASLIWHILNEASPYGDIFLKS